MRRVIAVLILTLSVLCWGCDSDGQTESYFDDEVTQYFRYRRDKVEDSVVGRYEVRRFQYDEECTLYENSAFKVYGIFPRTDRFSTYVECREGGEIFSHFSLTLGFYDGEYKRIVTQQTECFGVRASELCELKFDVVAGAEYIGVVAVEGTPIGEDLIYAESSRILPAEFDTKYGKASVESLGNNRVRLACRLDEEFQAVFTLLNRKRKMVEQFVCTEGKTDVDEYTDYGSVYCTLIISRRSNGD